MDLSPIRPRNGWRSYLYSSKIPHYVLDSARKANRPLKDVTLWMPMRHACWRCSRPLPGVRARTETNSHFGASTDATRRRRCRTTSRPLESDGTPVRWPLAQANLFKSGICIHLAYLTCGKTVLEPSPESDQGIRPHYVKAAVSV